QAGSTVPRKPTTLQGPGVKMPNPEYNQEAIEKWHKEHDAEVAELRQKLESPDCATLNHRETLIHILVRVGNGVRSASGEESVVHPQRPHVICTGPGRI